MSVKGVAPACRGCGNHPRSKAHQDACKKGTAKTRTTVVAAGTVAGPKKRTKRMGRRVAEIIPPNPALLPEQWELGTTCLTCKTIFHFTKMPEYQDPDTKHGKYDVLKQVPNTSDKYPLCEHCLAFAWRKEAKRFDMVKEVADAYSFLFY